MNIKINKEKDFWFVLMLLVTLCITSCYSVSTPTPTIAIIEEEIDNSPPLPTTLEGLIEALSGSSVSNRMRAARLLGAMGSEAKAAVPSLSQNLYYEGPYDVRQYSAWALGEIGPDAKPAVPLLTVVLLTDFVHARREAAEALGKIGDISAIPALAKALENGVDDASIESAETIGILTNQIFPDMGGLGYSLDENGIPLIVIAAKEWWQEEGQYQDWVQLENNID